MDGHTHGTLQGRPLRPMDALAAASLAASCALILWIIIPH
jgi:hypothetical protein